MWSQPGTVGWCSRVSLTPGSQLEMQTPRPCPTPDPRMTTAHRDLRGGGCEDLSLFQRSFCQVWIKNSCITGELRLCSSERLQAEAGTQEKYDAHSLSLLEGMSRYFTLPESFFPLFTTSSCYLLILQKQKFFPRRGGGKFQPRTNPGRRSSILLPILTIPRRCLRKLVSDNSQIISQTTGWVDLKQRSLPQWASA